MATTEWVYFAIIFCRDVAVGNAFAGAIGFGLTDGEMFSHATRLTRAGEAGETRFAALPLKSAGYAAISEFAAGGYPAALLAAGYGEAQIDAVRGTFDILVGARAALESQGLVEIAARGYEIIPEAE